MFAQSTLISYHTEAFVKTEVACTVPKGIFLAVAKAKGKGGKTVALDVEAKGEAEGLIFVI